MTLVVFTRGGIPESEHRVTWCVADADGALLAGDSAAVFARSATKPLQALPPLRDGSFDAIGFQPRHLALAASSHGGGEAHTRGVAEMLAAAGLGEADLGCGALAPRDPAVAAAMQARGEHPGRITHNCSGKHALALAHAVHRGWGVGGYMEPGHPVQAAMRAAVTAAAGAEPDDVLAGTDGCGMCTFHLPLAGLATAFARLAAGGLGEAGERVRAAMRAHPELVAYDGAIDTELMRAVDGLVAKVGAEGVLAAGLPDGRGLALKVRDGAMRAVDPAAIALVRAQLGLEVDTPALAALAEPPVLNSRGDRVGGVTVRLPGHQRR